MARTEKKSKIKGLPPQISLTERDSLQGSYPAVNNPVVTGTIVFNDLSTIPFATSSIYYGLGISTGSPYAVPLSYMTTSLTGPGRVVAGVADTFVQFSASLRNSPFRDNDQYAADGKSNGSTMFASGAQLSNFGAPLWSKEKIEINLSANATTTFGENFGPSKTSASYMVYYNHASASWMPVGSPRVATYYVSQALSIPTRGITDWYNDKAIGFGAVSINQNLASENSVVLNSVRPMSEFGFPFAQKYFVPTTGPSSSILYPMDRIITRPFMLEAIALEFTGSHTSGDFLSAWSGGAVGFAASFFFILNQRKNFQITQPVTLQPYGTSFPTNGTASYTVTHSAGLMDLVTALPIFTPGKTKAAWDTNTSIMSTRESTLGPALTTNKNLNFLFPTGSATDVTQLKWSGRYIVSGVCCAPVARDPADSVTSVMTIRSGTLGNNYTTLPTFRASRNGTSAYLSNRNFLNTVLGYQKITTYDPYNDVRANENSLGWTTNPYLLLPEDQLIFGWQSAFAGNVFERMAPDGIFVTGSGDVGAQLTLASGKATLVLYGSYIADNSQADVTTQVLSSNAIHEALE